MNGGGGGFGGGFGGMDPSEMKEILAQFALVVVGVGEVLLVDSRFNTQEILFSPFFLLFSLVKILLTYVRYPGLTRSGKFIFCNRYEPVESSLSRTRLWYVILFYLYIYSYSVHGFL